MDELITVGGVARRSGLTTKALRHYDAIGLLVPREIDPSSGYRRYGPEQVERARTIRRLRDLDVPLPVIRDLLDANDPRKTEEVLARHIDGVEAETWRQQRILHRLRQMTGGNEMTTNEDTQVDVDEERRLAADLFNQTWTLLEQPNRTQAEDDRMLHAAHASRFHWDRVGTPENLAIGEWQCSRVYAMLGRAEPSLHHARRALQISEEAALDDWVVAGSYEAIARAHGVAGDREEADAWKTRAQEAAEAIADPEERDIIMGDVATLP